MPRGLVTLVLLALALLCAAPTASARSWAQPQIQEVVELGLMGPSVAGFRPDAPLTRGALGRITANLTGKPQVVVDPDRNVTLRQLDRALVRAAGLAGPARAFRRKVSAAGLDAPARLGTEVVARLLWLRYNHPAAKDFRELRPHDVVNRAEAAYSTARVLDLDDGDRYYVRDLAARFSLPAFTVWKRRVLDRAVRFVGYPYIWGGTSEGRQTLFGATSRGGFDCSGFVWRVYKLEPFAGAPQLQDVLRGRTTYAMSGEFPRSQRISRSSLRPADLVFFGSRGPRSSPSEVDHMGIYLGRGWVIHSSGQGVTLVPLTGWYADRFAWGRRPLREAGLS
ncbi:MAG TPA: NlpC/P60 family protein [Gaiellaceae bacterium]|nr:NlpC/P60 family protein [Gaiellaceae bacterium]